MLSRFVPGVCLLCGMLLPGVASSQVQRLSREDQRVADQVTRAYFAGAPVHYAVSVSGLLQRSNAARLAKVDAALTAELVPTTGELMTEAHLHAIHNGLTHQLPRPSLREVLVVVDQLGAHVSTSMRSIYRSDVMTDPLADPSTLREYDGLVWESQMLESKVRDAVVIVGHMQRLAGTLSKTQLAKLDESSQTQLDETNDIFREVQTLLDELEERQAELRLKRLALALRTLHDPTLSAERFRAAYTAPIDAELLTNYLSAAKDRQAGLEREALRSSELIQQVAADRETARQLAGNLTEKSQKLFVGLHWWLRGRYGVGSDAFGLAKSPAAMYSVQAQMALHMPQRFPVPNDQEQGSSYQQAPCLDRRHHYWWAWEDRRVQRITTHSAEAIQQSGDPNRISVRPVSYFM